MRILVLGSGGQVGWELVRSCQPLGEVVAVDRAQLDLSDVTAIRSAVRGFEPDVIVNAAAYTAVDKAETEEALALAINGTAVAVLADEAARQGVLLVHISTDYVFDGSKAAPYVPEDATAPLSAYGRTKLAGEQALAASGAEFLCFRTSWVYSSRGRNFLQTMLGLARERAQLRVVSDQIGAPTTARLIADSIAHAILCAQGERARSRFRPAILHLTASGATSWHGFACEIVEQARALDTLGPLAVENIVAIPTEAHPLPARRPRNSRLDCSTSETRFGLSLPCWQAGLALCLAELAQ